MTNQKTPQQAYEKLMVSEKERSLLLSTEALLSWDESVYMPARGGALRGEQKALLARLMHEGLASDETKELLARASESGFAPDSVEEANLREIRRSHTRAKRISTQLVEALARAGTAGREAWVEARKTSEFAIFQPHLEKLVELKQAEAEAVGYEEDPYDAFLDVFEPGGHIKEIVPLFGALKPELVRLLQEVQGGKRKPNPQILTRHFPIDKQRELGERAAARIGFDFTRGRLDTTAHPFCSGFGPNDVRITTRYDEHYFPEGFSGILHEAGHGLYEQGLDFAHEGTPAGRACSMAIHESQSRIWENYVTRGRPFWDYFYPETQKAFPESLGSVSLDDFLLAINEVQPSFIRVEADEVTYNLHIILRLELERAILSKDLLVKDIPGAWNEKFQAMFGIRPANDAQGCLQDIHWCWGAFGYFPTYALGNMYGAQFVEQANQDLGELGAHFRRGDFAQFHGWLKENIHRHGQRYLASDLVRRITGKPLSHEPLIRQLRAKYRELYQF